MTHFLKDKTLLLPIVEKTDILYTKFGILPNTITIFNSLIVSNIVLYGWMTNNYIFSFIFLMIRLILDGADGIIARKYKLGTQSGEVYDHISDSIFMGFIFFTFCYKLCLPICCTLIISHLVMIVCMILNFNYDLIFLSEKIFGAGGSYDAYCTLLYILAQIIIVSIDYYMK
tara:strand:- start:39 stop:554 length:516 start_codon:yes stop_codon:yes gene_type:complete